MDTTVNTVDIWLPSESLQFSRLGKQVNRLPKSIMLCINLGKVGVELYGGTEKTHIVQDSSKVGLCR